MSAQWQCPKCGKNDYEIGEFRATGGALAKIFDVQNKKFTTVTCNTCKYTEIYRADSGSMGSIFDFLFGG